MWKRCSGHVRAARIAWAKKTFFTTISATAPSKTSPPKLNIDQTNGPLRVQRFSTFDYDDDGWPDIYVACDSTASILYPQQSHGTFTDVAVVAGAAFNDEGGSRPGMGIYRC